ncbi:MAG: DUF2946 family protein [Acidobacteria bacterium]|nr:DUF2946 family protein [Acidobacteriota bacterium]
MKLKSTFNSSHAKRLRMVAALLLGLLLHALYVVSTHHHSISLVGATSALPGVSQDHHSPEQHLPHSSDDFHCATCNLQRGLASQHTPPVFVLQLTRQTINREFLHFEPHSVGAFPSSISRAPPLV